MAIEDTLKDLVARIKAPQISGPDWQKTAETLRNNFYTATRKVETDVPTLRAVEPVTVQGAAGPLEARLYVPLGASEAPGPGLIFFHGGGFVLGSLDTHDMLCRRLADASACRVLSVAYRLAPEHTFPAAHDDALAAWDDIVARALTFGLDADRLAVGGDSAGANLSTYIAQEMVHVSDHKPAFQLLLYPLLQMADIRSTNLKFKEGGFFISTGIFEFVRDSYLRHEGDRMDVRASPLFAGDERLKSLPPTHIVLCGWDPLRHEARAYADKLRAMGVPVTVEEFESMTHGFMNMTAVSETARTACRRTGALLGMALGPQKQLT